jgi:hypothetical protein
MGEMIAILGSIREEIFVETKCSFLIPRGFGGNNQPKGFVNDNPKSLVLVQNISPAQMDERKRKGLCYSCDAKWSREHVCVAPKLFLIEEVKGQKEIIDVVAVDREEEDPRQFFWDEGPEISLNAITCTPNPKL